MCFEFALVASTLTGPNGKVPGTGERTGNSLTAFGVGTDGEIIIARLLLSMVDFGTPIFLGPTIMRSECPGKYAAGFVGAFELACNVFWTAHPMEIKSRGSSAAFLGTCVLSLCLAGEVLRRNRERDIDA